MIVEIEIPELPVHYRWFPTHWLNVVFLNSRPKAYRVHAICSSYIRLVEWAAASYDHARQNVSVFWNNAGEVKIQSFVHAACQLEDCFNAMHRAVWCMKRMRNRADVKAELKGLFQERPTFTKDNVAGRIRAVRDAVQHMEEQVFKGTIPENTEFMLTATGPESPYPQPGNPAQTIKVIDRVRIGSNEVLFADMANWIGEMAKCAEKLANFTGFQAEDQNAE